LLSQLFKLSKYVPKILGKGKLALLCAFGILIFTLWSNVGAYAQNRTAAAVNDAINTKIRFLNAAMY
jgi:hypothetical protein